MDLDRKCTLTRVEGGFSNLKRGSKEVSCDFLLLKPGFACCDGVATHRCGDFGAYNPGPAIDPRRSCRCLGSLLSMWPGTL